MDGFVFVFRFIFQRRQKEKNESIIYQKFSLTSALISYSIIKPFAVV
jgi:hypothetical protein